MAPVGIIDLAKFLTSEQLRDFVSDSYKALSGSGDRTVEETVTFRIGKDDIPRFNDCMEVFRDLSVSSGFSEDASRRAAIVFSEIVDNGLQHGCETARDKIIVKCVFTVGGLSISVTQPKPLPDKLKRYAVLSAFKDWETFNRGSAIGWQTIVHFSDHIKFVDPTTLCCSVYKSAKLDSTVSDSPDSGTGAPKDPPENLVWDPELNEFVATEPENPVLVVDVVARIGKVRVVSLKGRVDHTNADRFHDEMHRLSALGDGIVLDLSELEFIVSAGLRAVLLLQRDLTRQGRVLAVSCVDGVVKEVFRISKFDALVRLFPTVNAAIAETLYDAKSST